MNIAISGIGLATAQGNSAQILAAKQVFSASQMPWAPNQWNISRCCYPAQGIDPGLTGQERWRALVQQAFADLDEREPAPDTPLLVGSCNGAATSSWEQAFAQQLLFPAAKEAPPVFSSSCASGLHALYAAKQLLAAGAVDEVLVLAADILSQTNHENFESLRVLAEQPGSPWQSTSTGFILGEAAVVLKLVRANDQETPLLTRLELQSDLADSDGLSGVLDALAPQRPSLILGQGTGPFESDTTELAAFSTFVEPDVPLATPLSHFGHTLGASGLLAVALGALSKRAGSPVQSLKAETSETSDKRPLLCSSYVTAGPPLKNILATCRALNGACAATIVGSESRAMTNRREARWRKSVMPGPLMNRTLEQIASEALEHRPANPPGVLILRLEAPLAPPDSAVIGKRLLPSAVLEITPGFASQLVARCWGFSGPALCLVGNVDSDPYGIRNALSESGLKVFQVNLRGSGDNRVIEWNV